VPVLLAATLLQSSALALTARTASAPYLALKMFYFAIYPLAVGGAYAVATCADRFAHGRSASRYASWIAVLVLLAAVGRSIASTAPKPVLSDSLLEAGRWARDHVPANCVDYLVADDDSAYWLHLAVLRNARTAPRSLASDTFDPHKAVERWILPGGLPYAIAADFGALPHDIRATVDVLARFGAAAVIIRRGAAACDSPR
jgi:asparagine N-glycosylation enzyme membrane subunit Stt3